MSASELSDRPPPLVDELSAPFWDAARDGRLVYQHCERCDRRQLPATLACPDCGGPLEWRTSTGTGQVFTYIVMHKAYHPAFVDRLPYAVGFVQIEEGPLVLTDFPGCLPAEVQVGMSVQVRFDEMPSGQVLPRFERTSREEQ